MRLNVWIYQKMKLIQLNFKKLGKHWYLDVLHDDPSDLKLDPRLERYIEYLDTWKEGFVNKIYLVEQTDLNSLEGLIQFSDKDLLKYFTTNSNFYMDLFISGHKFTISSRLYSILENNYHVDFHIAIYKISIF